MIQTAANETRLARVVDVFERYPDRNNLARVLGRLAPRVVIIDGEDLELAVRCAGAVRQQVPEAALIGVSTYDDTFDTLRQIIPVTVPYPPNIELLGEALSVAVHRGEARYVENLIAFLPAKGGVGASTIALNTAAAMASSGKKTVLMDADLRSGALSLMLNCLPCGSMQKALEGAADEETFNWKPYITHAHDVDFVLSARVPVVPPPTWAHYHVLIQSAVARYDTVLADLPELVNPGTVEIVKSARYVMVVATQEVLPLKMAERRMSELMEWGVPPDRIKLLVNRWHKKEIGKEEIEKFVRRPVYATFANDFQTVRRAMMDGAPVAASTGLGHDYQAFVQALNGVKVSSGWLSKLRG